MFSSFNNLLIAASLIFFSIPMMGCGDNNGETPVPPIPKPTPAPDDYKYPKANDAVRIMTYNSFYCKSNTDKPAFTEENTRAFANVIKALNPDVIVVQELDSNSSERSRRYLLQDIQKATGIDYAIVFGSAARYDGGKIGCGMMYKKTLPVKSVRQIALPGKEARKLIIASFDKFTLMGTHLDLETRHRQSSIDLIEHEMPQYKDAPVFFAGDLNDSPAWKAEVSAFQKISSIFNIISETSGSLPAQPGVTIDYILVDKLHRSNVEVKQTHVVKRLYLDGEDKDIATVSDHYPVFVDVKIK